MWSDDELHDGVTFLLKLINTAGEVFCWVETLRGETATHWHEIYRTGQFETLRSQAMSVFHRRVTEREAEMIRRARTRCIYIDAEVDDLRDSSDSSGFICNSVQAANGISDEHSD